jgi:hypothetical protein
MMLSRSNTERVRWPVIFMITDSGTRPGVDSGPLYASDRGNADPVSLPVHTQASKSPGILDRVCVPRRSCSAKIRGTEIARFPKTEPTRRNIGNCPICPVHRAPRICRGVQCRTIRIRSRDACGLRHSSVCHRHHVTFTRRQDDELRVR